MFFQTQKTELDSCVCVSVCQWPGAASVYMCAALWIYVPALAFRQPWKYTEIPKTSLASSDTQTHTQRLPADRSSPQEHGEGPRHRRSKMRTISKIDVSPQRKGSVRSDGPPNGLVIKDEDTEDGGGGEERQKRGLWEEEEEEKKKKGGKDPGYLLSDGPAEMCWAFALGCEASRAVSTVQVLFIILCVRARLACIRFSCEAHARAHACSLCSGKTVLQVSGLFCCSLQRDDSVQSAAPITELTPQGITGIFSASYFSATPGSGYLGRHDMTE